MRAITLLSLLPLLACKQDIAVRDVLLPPTVRFEAPVDGATFAERDTVSLVVLVGDDQDAPDALSVRWVSSLDGPLSPLPTTGQGISDASTLLSPGRHRIEVSVTDSDGLVASAARTLTVSDDPDAPLVEIVRPLVGEDATENLAYTVSARVTDDRDAPGDLEILIGSDLDGALCSPTVDALGELYCDVVLSAGQHLLTFEAIDSEGNIGSAEAYLRVIALTATDDDGDGWSEDQGDCNDNNDAIHPGATEICDGVDSDCDGVVDEDTSCGDDDGDGFSEVDGDCDDTDDTIYPGAPEALYDGVDSDCGGDDDFDQDGDGVSLVHDCDDTDPDVLPGAIELCNGIDDDCDDTTDEGTSCYDDDGDGQTEDQGDCNDADPGVYLGAPDAWYDGIDSDCGADDDFDQDGDGVGVDDDCDDQAAFVRPGAPELCNGIDDDCDLGVDEGTFCYDDDGDGVTEEDGDCDDSDPTRYPGAVEVWYDGVDSDCAGDDDFDQDGDGYDEATDCDDTAPAVNPAAIESCNGFDDDCDGATDEGVTNPYYRDADGDGYGNGSVVLDACSLPAGYVTNSDDCYDSNTAARPGTTAWQSSHRGDGSFDFNCDGTSSKRYTANWTCFENADGDIQWANGWSTSSDPACGTTGTQATGCDWHLGFPDFWNVYIDGPESTSSLQQTCR